MSRPLRLSGPQFVLRHRYPCGCLGSRAPTFQLTVDKDNDDDGRSDDVVSCGENKDDNTLPVSLTTTSDLCFDSRSGRSIGEPSRQPLRSPVSFPCFGLVGAEL